MSSVDAGGIARGIARGYRRIERDITAVTGAVFVGVGARLAAEQS